MRTYYSYCDAHKLDLPPVLAAVADLEMVTVATDTLREGLEQLVSAPFCTGLSLAELRRVKQCRAVLNEPQECGREDFTKFVATLALSVNVDASLHHVECSDDIAIQVQCFCVPRVDNKRFCNTNPLSVPITRHWKVLESCHSAPLEMCFLMASFFLLKPKFSVSG